jgi:hypothetical protein
MNQRRLFCLLSFMVFFACRSPKTVTDSTLTSVEWGQLKSAYLGLPVSISLAKVEKKVNESIPWQFNNAAWPAFDQRGCGEPQIKYTVSRDSIHLKPEGNTLYFDMNLSYGIEGNYCPLCYDGQCKAPALPFSCGVQKETPRRMHWVGKIIWSIGADFQLKTRSETLKLKALDPCEFTFLKVDFTKMVQQEFEKAISGALQAGDQQMNKINLLSAYQPTLSDLNRGIDLKDNGFLSVVPQIITMGPVELKNKRMVTWLGVQSVLSWSNEPLKIPGKRPQFQYVKDPKIEPWDLEVALSWEAIQRLIQGQWEGKALQLNDQGDFLLFNKLDIEPHKQNWIKVSGVVNIETKKLSRKNVRFEIQTKPSLDAQGQQLILDEILFDLGFKNKIIEAGIGWELMQKRWKDVKYNQIDLQSILNSVVMEANEKLVGINTQKFGMNGSFQKASISKMNVDDQGFKMTLALSGQWELLINP